MEVAVYRSGERSMELVGLAALLALAALWGGSFLFIRVASPVMGPLALAELRIGLAGLALLIATSPLFGVLVAAAWPRESLPARPASPSSSGGVRCRATGRLSSPSGHTSSPRCATASPPPTPGPGCRACRR